MFAIGQFLEKTGTVHILVVLFGYFLRVFIYLVLLEVEGKGTIAYIDSGFTDIDADNLFHLIISIKRW